VALNLKIMLLLTSFSILPHVHAPSTSFLTIKNNKSKKSVFPLKMSSVRRLIQFILTLLSYIRKIFQKIPVSAPSRRDIKNFLTPQKENEGKMLKASSSFNVSSHEPGDYMKKTPIDKYKHIRSKVNTHWSPEEKHRTGLSTFFARKAGNSSASSSAATSPEMQRQALKIAKRKSLTIAIDPIAAAIAQLKSSSSQATNSSSNSSFVSLPEWPTNQE
jgi:hypothetical protein